MDVYQNHKEKYESEIPDFLRAIILHFYMGHLLIHHPKGVIKYSFRISTTGIIAVQWLRLYYAGHTHVSLMLKQGVYREVVRKELGNSSIQMIISSCSYVVPGLQEVAVRFLKIFSSKLVAELAYA